ncbi:MAG: cytochrome-c peroxidase [Sphingobacteriales bacterium]|nr:MAG: cytochrome-c peroxidase [Sphingobacteriales bacterium]
MNYKYSIFIVFFLTGLYACEKEMIDDFIGFKKPAHFPEPVYQLDANPITKERFELGKKLFYETLLSANNSISCGSCHIQTSAFTHHGHTISHGIEDRLGTRNSPPIFNLAWSSSFMWDGGIADLDLQSVAPITNHVEMDETMENVLRKLSATAPYPSMFEKAYGTKEITTSNFLKALSQFMLMCVSSNSKYDSVMRGDAEKQFTADELAGRELVKLKCGNCHTEPLFTNHSFRNNGLIPSSVNDEGRFMITQLPEDRYKFKVPSLRNLAYTAPYMHDGRLLSLDGVLDHYSRHVQPIENLDPLLQQNGVLGIPLNTEERKNILAFLNTLNDRSFLFDKRFAE